MRIIERVGCCWGNEGDGDGCAWDMVGGDMRGSTHITLRDFHVWIIKYLISNVLQNLASERILLYN